MGSPIRSLIWKECREQWLKPVLAAAVLVGIVLTGSMWGPRDVGIEFATFLAICLGAGLFPLVIAAGIIAGERSHGTLELMATIPVRPWKVLLVKTLVGLLACELPLVAMHLAVMVAIRVSPVTAERNRNLQLFALGAATFAALQFLWTQFLGARRATEIGAAMNGALGTLLAIISYWLLGIPLHHGMYAGDWLVSSHPLALLRIIANVPWTGWPETRIWMTQGIVQTVTLGCGWAWMLHVWSRPLVSAQSRHPAKSQEVCNVAKPFSGPWSSLYWKEWREIRTAIPAAAAVIIAPMVLVAGAMLLGSARPRQMLVGVAWIALIMSWALAVAMPVLIAAGSVCSDLNPKAADFWRSRPIHGGRAFVAKYVTGFAVVLAVQCLSLIVVAIFLPNDWDSWDYLAPELHDYAIWTAILGTAELLVAYSLAVLIASAIAKPVTAAILTWSLLALINLLAFTALKWGSAVLSIREIQVAVVLGMTTLGLVIAPPFCAWRLWTQRGLGLRTRGAKPT